MSMTTVDAHIHIFKRGTLPQKWYELGRQRWAASKWPPTTPDKIDIEAGLIEDDDLSLLTGELDAAQIRSAVCLTLDWGVRYGEPEIGLRDTHAWYGDLQRRFRGRIYAVAGCDPRRPDAADILDQALGRDNLRGVKLYPPTGFYANEEMCNPIYEKCLEYDVPLVVHSAFVGYPHAGYYANPLYLNDVQNRYPELRIVLAHSGYPFWAEEAIELAAHHANTYLEISNWNWLLRKDPERLRAVLKSMIAHVGAHRVIYASDHLGGYRNSGTKSKMQGYREFVESLARVEGSSSSSEMQISSDEMSLIMHENADRVFKLAQEGPTKMKEEAS